MTKRARRTHSAALKAKISLAFLAGDKTLAQLAQRFEVHPNQITEWKRQLSERAADVFGGTVVAEPPVDVKVLHAKIGQLTLENDFLESALNLGGIAERKAMIDGHHALSISRQAQLAGISRGSVYYLLRPVSPADLALMRRIDELHLEHPFMGARMTHRKKTKRGAPSRLSQSIASSKKRSSSP